MLGVDCVMVRAKSKKVGKRLSKFRMKYEVKTLLDFCEDVDDDSV